MAAPYSGPHRGRVARWPPYDVHVRRPGDPHDLYSTPYPHQRNCSALESTVVAGRRRLAARRRCIRAGAAVQRPDLGDVMGEPVSEQNPDNVLNAAALLQQFLSELHAFTAAAVGTSDDAGALDRRTDLTVDLVRMVDSVTWVVVEAMLVTADALPMEIRALGELVALGRRVEAFWLAPEATRAIAAGCRHETGGLWLDISTNVLVNALCDVVGEHWRNEAQTVAELAVADRTIVLEAVTRAARREDGSFGPAVFLVDTDPGAGLLLAKNFPDGDLVHCA